MWRSTNFGANWGRLASGTMDKYDVRAVAVKAIDASNYVLFAGTSTGKVYTSTNGTNWTQTNSVGAGVDEIRSLTVTDLGGTPHVMAVLAGTDEGIHRSFYDGANWESTLSAGGGIRKMTVAKDDQTLMYAASPGAAWKSTSAGYTWDDVSAGLGRMPASSVVSNGSSLWTVSDQYDSFGYFNGSSWTTTEVSGFYGEQVMRNSSNSYLFASGLSTPSNPKAALYRSTDGGSTYGTWYVSTTQGSGNGFLGSMKDPANGRS